MLNRFNLLSTRSIDRSLCRSLFRSLFRSLSHTHTLTQYDPSCSLALLPSFSHIGCCVYWALLLHCRLLDMTGNGLNGSLPAMWSSWSNLRLVLRCWSSSMSLPSVNLGLPLQCVCSSELDMGFNLLSGSIPSNISLLTSRFTSLSVANNALNGSLPVTMSSLVGLR